MIKHATICVKKGKKHKIWTDVFAYTYTLSLEQLAGWLADRVKEETLHCLSFCFF